ncbi:MAG TPA: outer membrane protein assembly factor BamE [Alphaproteobacteria bacterium]|jgi:outer membrane protein assembly factor BamE (lipoprotein component of BamABCDE complex)|nr:outer membrane protein assembly factor BamE [Alphaproteobacteria bacterium]
MNATTHKPRIRPCLSPLLALAALTLVACEPRLDTHGFMPNSELVSQIQTGDQDKFEVAEVLGSPSTMATFDDDIWYYITQQSRIFAFFKPEIVDQQVLVVRFDEANVVSEINRYTIEDGLIVDPVTRETPTAGKELSILQQLFGNIGRFAK